jgi:hypothetical protein
MSSPSPELQEMPNFNMLRPLMKICGLLFALLSKLFILKEYGTIFKVFKDRINWRTYNSDVVSRPVVVWWVYKANIGRCPTA